MKKRLISTFISVIMVLMLIPTSAFAEEKINLDERSFPDAAFRQYIKDNFDSDKDNSLSSSEIQNIIRIDIGENKVI